MKNILHILSILILTLSLSLQTAYAQERVITGTVTAPDNSTLPGATIQVKGTTTGTVTDFDGAYSISVPDGNAVIVFRFVGFQQKEVIVGEQTTIDVVLQDSQNLEEVVVVGYGVTKKSDLTGAISSISEEELTERPVESMGMAIQGKASGVQVSSTSGMPGSTASIRIRGHGSLGTSNAPLWVIDGYVGADMNSVAPEDIESLEILKDASSTAIYGARGGNGVIIVTTKKGKANQNTLTFSTYTQFRSVINKMNVLDASEYMTLRNQAIVNDGGMPKYSQDEIELRVPVASTGYIANTDWQDAVFGNALSTYYSLGFSGGTDVTKYAMSANHITSNGIIPNSKYKRTGFLLNMSHEISDMFDLGTSVKGYMSKQEGFEVPTGSSWAFGPAGNAVVSLPIYPIYDSTNNYYNTSTWDNPLYASEAEHDHKTYNIAQGNIYLNFKPFDGLSILSTISGETRMAKREHFVPSDLYEATRATLRSRAQIAESHYYKWIGNIVATYNKTIKENHDISVMLGIEQQVINSNSHSIIAEDVSKESLMWYDLSAYNQDFYVASSDYWGSVFRSQFSRLSYIYKNKYLLMGTIRRDGSSKFSTDNQFGIFPSISAAWKMHYEDFIANLGVFSQLKLRASWGQSGNDQIPLYQWLPGVGYNMSHTNAVFGDQLYNGAVITKIPNKSITWETSTTVDIGIDMSFFSDRLNITTDYYNRTTTNLLWADLLPLYTGFGDGWNPQDQYFPASIWSNIAEMNNQGIELGINAIIVDRGDWYFDASLNFAANKNEVKYLGGQKEFFIGVTKVEVGQPIGNIYGYKRNGLYSIQDSIGGSIPAGKRPGDQKFADLNGDGLINSDDQEVIGNALPDFTAGLSGNLSYKNFSFSMNWIVVQGNDMYNGTYQTLADGSLLKYNGGEFLLDSWTNENTNTDVPRLSSSFYDLNSDRYVEDASFIKLTNAMISYDFSNRLLSRIKISKLKLYVSGQNLLVFTNYSGFDPEQSSGGDSNLNLGYDSKNYPTSRSFTFGLNLTL